MIRAYAFAAAMLLAWPHVVLCQPAKAVDADVLAKVREAARGLSREVEFLAEDIVSELGAAKERTLYQRTDALLVSVDAFLRLLKAETPREEIDKSFDRLDEQVHGLMAAVAESGKDNRLLQRAAARVGWADDQLHHALFMGDPAENRLAETLQRRAGSLADSADRLERAASYSLASTPGREVLIGNAKKLAAACRRFEKSVDDKAGRETLSERFADVTQAWQRVAQGMEDLKTSESTYVLHSASQIDRLHESIFRTLGGKGDRPRLILRT